MHAVDGAVAAPRDDAPVAPEDRGPGDLRGAGARSPLFWKLMLAAMALIWGYSFTTMKTVTDAIPTFTLLAFRFVPAALLMLALFHGRIRAHLNRRYLAIGLGIGVFLWGGYAAQTLGLVGTTAGKSSFLTGTYCVLVPFVSYLVSRERLTRYNVGAAVLCLAGIALVALDDFSVEPHDLLTLLGALFYALELAFTSKLCKDVDINVVTFWMFVTTGVLSAATALAFETPPAPATWSVHIWIQIAFLAVICTCVALLVQNAGLAHVPASTGSLLLSLESPSGVLFSCLLMGEVVTPRLLLGFALIFVAIIVSETHLSFLKRG